MMYSLLIFQENKIKEGLYMMGLNDEIFHLSWFITYALQVQTSLPSFYASAVMYIVIGFFFIIIIIICYC